MDEQEPALFSSLGHGVWTHHAGTKYRIVCTTHMTRNATDKWDEPGRVIYQSLLDGRLYDRTIGQFMNYFTEDKEVA